MNVVHAATISAALGHSHSSATVATGPILVVFEGQRRDHPEAPEPRPAQRPEQILVAGRAARSDLPVRRHDLHRRRRCHRRARAFSQESRARRRASGLQHRRSARYRLGWCDVPPPRGRCTPLRAERRRRCAPCPLTPRSPARRRRSMTSPLLDDWPANEWPPERTANGMSWLVRPLDAGRNRGCRTGKCDRERLDGRRIADSRGPGSHRSA